MREVFNAILYLLRTGCAWRMLPHEFPPWGTVHDYYRKYRIDGTWERIHDRLREKTRQKAHAKCRHHRFAERENNRKRGIRGYDGGKKITGRKRRIIVETLGMILVVMVHNAEIQDRMGVEDVVLKIHRRFDGGQSVRLVA